MYKFTSNYTEAYLGVEGGGGCPGCSSTPSDGHDKKIQPKLIGLAKRAPH